MIVSPSQPIPQTPPRPCATAITIDNVRVHFRRRGAKPVQALHDLSLNVPSGQVFCLLGPNGSGKTTTINLITGMLEPTRGSVRVLGANPTRARRKTLQKIALVPQETALYGDLSARENLSFHGHYYGVPAEQLTARIEQMLELVQLRARQHDRVNTFSGGMQRRLALARALLTDPAILLLDEPTLGVDVHSRQAIWEQIKELTTAGKTVFLTTNTMEEAEALADTIAIVDRGTAVAVGTPAKLKARVQHKHLSLQFAASEHAQQAGERLRPHYQARVRGSKVILELERDTDASQVMAQLPSMTAGLPAITNLELRDPSLQDVFLHLTGDALRD